MFLSSLDCNLIVLDVLCYRRASFFDIDFLLDVMKWRDLDTVNLLVCIGVIVILATLSRASCTVIIAASGVSGIVLVI